MATFTVTPDATRVPAVRLAARDEVELGNQIAVHYARHKHLSRAIPFQAQIGSDVGAIHQAGLTKPLTFTIRKDS